VSLAGVVTWCPVLFRLACAGVIAVIYHSKIFIAMHGLECIQKIFTMAFLRNFEGSSKNSHKMNLISYTMGPC
jgi:hypothetical protein